MQSPFFQSRLLPCFSQKVLLDFFFRYAAKVRSHLIARMPQLNEDRIHQQFLLQNCHWNEWEQSNSSGICLGESGCIFGLSVSMHYQAPPPPPFITPASPLKEFNIYCQQFKQAAAAVSTPSPLETDEQQSSETIHLKGQHQSQEASGTSSKESGFFQGKRESKTLNQHCFRANAADHKTP